MTTCACDSQIQPHEWRKGVCPAILKVGSVLITADHVLVDGFHFAGLDMTEGGDAAIDWARTRLAEAQQRWHLGIGLDGIAVDS